MVNSETLKLIQEHNLSYLLLAQKLLQEDKQMGMFRLHFDESMADLILSLSTGQLLEISGSGQLLCQISFNDPELIKRLYSNDRSKTLRQVHAALMLSQSTLAKVPADDS